MHPVGGINMQELNLCMKCLVSFFTQTALILTIWKPIRSANSLYSHCIWFSIRVLHIDITLQVCTNEISWLFCSVCYLATCFVQFERIKVI